MRDSVLRIFHLLLRAVKLVVLALRGILADMACHLPSRAALLFAILVAVPALAASEPSPSRFENGTRYVDGKPFFSRAGYFGYNHWMTQDEKKSLGNIMRIPFEQVGTAKDFYSQAGFNTGYYSVWGHTWLDGKDYDPTLTYEAFRRGKKAGQKVVVQLPVLTPESVTKKLDFHWIAEDGEKIPFGKTWGMHHDPEQQALAIRQTYQQVFDKVRDEPLNIGYQLGSERWAYDYVRVGKDVSFDDWSLDRFREFLKKRFSLEQVGERYGKSKSFYSSWAEVFPPVSAKPKAFRGKDLSNWDVARWDWYCYRDQVTADVWVRMIEEFQKMDGTGRPFSFEHNHGPYYSMGFHPFPEICARTKNFSVGNGDFTPDLMGTLAYMIQVKGCGEGPWINNELCAGTTDRHMDAAHQRRKIWGTVALGAGGYHLWTFFNLMGASSEFTSDTYYDPVLPNNLPPKYFEVQHANKMLESLGETLAASKSPPPRLALLLLNDSIFLNKFTSDYRPEGENFARAIGTRGYADALVMYTQWHLDNTPLEGIEAIVLPRMPRILESRAEKLAAFVERGGVLILMGPTGRYDELFEAHTPFPYGKLGAAAGVQMVPLNAEGVRIAPLAFDWKGRTINFDVQVELKIPEGSKAEPLLSNDGRIFAAKNRYGKGLVYTLPGFPIVMDESDPTADFVAGLLTDGGIRTTASLKSEGKTNPGIMAAVRKGPQGTLLFLVENQNAKQAVDVRLDAGLLDLDPSKTYHALNWFGDESHQLSSSGNYSFATMLEPAGVRVFLISERSSLEDLVPKSKKHVVPTDPDAVIAEKASRGMPYYAGSAVREAGEWLRSRSIPVSPSASPVDLGAGFLGLNFSEAENSSLARLIKDVDSSAFVNYGNTESTGDAGAALGFRSGINNLGDVPFLSTGRFLALETAMQVNAIPVNSRVEAFHFFQGTQHGQDRSTMGWYRVNYKDGSSVRIPIVIGVTLSDFSRGVKFAAKTTPFSTVSDKGGKKIELRRFDWKNPSPDKPVASIDIVGRPTADPRTINIWAITAKTLP